MATGAEFDSAAELYDRARPGYSDALFRICVEYGEIAMGDHCLELGSGTGIATEKFAAHGLRVTAVEPGPDMMAIARRRLARFGDRVKVVENDFEGALTAGQLEGPYGGALAATSWHFLTPHERTVPEIHGLIRSAGWLAILHNVHPLLDGSSTFYADTERIFAKHQEAAGIVVSAISSPADLKPKPLDERYFTTVFFGWESAHKRFSTIDPIGRCLDYLKTDWRFLELEPHRQVELEQDLREYLKERHSGKTITIPRTSSIQMARKIG